MNAQYTPEGLPVITPAVYQERLMTYNSKERIRYIKPLYNLLQLSLSPHHVLMGAYADELVREMDETSTSPTELYENYMGGFIEMYRIFSYQARKSPQLIQGIPIVTISTIDEIETERQTLPNLQAYDEVLDKFEEHTETTNPLIQKLGMETLDYCVPLLKELHREQAHIYAYLHGYTNIISVLQTQEYINLLTRAHNN